MKAVKEFKERKKIGKQLLLYRKIFGKIFFLIILFQIKNLKHFFPLNLTVTAFSDFLFVPFTTASPFPSIFVSFAFLSIYRILAIISHPNIFFQTFWCDFYLKIFSKTSQKALLVRLLLKRGFYSRASYNSENTVCNISSFEQSLKQMKI